MFLPIFIGQMLTACTMPEQGSLVYSQGGTLSSAASTPPDTGADTGTDTGSPSEQAPVFHYSGSATVESGKTVSYQGDEEVRVTVSAETDAVLCLIHYSLTSTSARTDCDGCAWAVELSVGAVQVEVGGATSEGDCAGVGIDPTALDGHRLVYGFQEDDKNAGEGSLMVLNPEGIWSAAGIASFDAQSGALVYGWSQDAARPRD